MLGSEQEYTKHKGMLAPEQNSSSIGGYADKKNSVRVNERLNSDTLVQINGSQTDY